MSKVRGGTMSGKHSPLGGLSTESSVTDVSKSVKTGRMTGISVPKSATNRPLSGERLVKA